MLELRAHELELDTNEQDAEDGTNWSIDAEARRLGVGAEVQSFSLRDSEGRSDLVSIRSDISRF